MDWPATLSAWAQAVKPPKRYRPSEWAEEHRVLPHGTNAEPGRFRNSRTPYLRGVADAILEQAVEEVVFVAGTQIGKTTAQENQIGYWIDNDPGPLLIVRPSEASCEEYVRERLRPMLETSPSLARHISQNRDDNLLKVIRLDTMPIYLAWAGSPQSLASRPCRYIILDEVDKFPEFSGREADPVSLALERTATFMHRRRVILTSTPTTENGAIWKAFLSCADKRFFRLPCPGCDVFQKLLWAQVKWPRIEGDRDAAADEIEQRGLAYYECPNCQRSWSHGDKLRMLDRGVWASEGQTVAAGHLAGERIRTKRVGFHLSSLYSPWRTFSSMAAEFLRAQGDIARVMNFRNSRLAEPFENVVASTTTDAIRSKCETAKPAGVVPSWSQVVVATADTQGDWFRVTVRSWGSGFRSQGLFEGRVDSFDDLYKFAFESQFSAESGGVVSPTCLLIDSGGSRTNEVYQFSLRDARIIPTKGLSSQGRKPWYATQLPNGVILRNFDTHYFKDMLSRIIHNDDAALWLPRKDASDAYCREMASEHKILDRAGNKMVWKVKSEGVANHAWDCEVLQCLAADMANLGALAPAPVNEVRKSGVAASEWLSRGKRW